MEQQKNRIKVEGSDKPVIDWDATVKILDDEFAMDVSVVSACKKAGISRAIFYEWLKENEWYLDRREALRNMPNYKARVNIAKAINKGDLKISQWYLERKDEEFKNKSSVEVDNKQPIIQVGSLEAKEKIEKLKK